VSLVIIRKLLQNKLTTIANPLPTAWENSRFKPGSSRKDPWQKVNLIPAPPENPTIATRTVFRESGIFQVNLYYPLNNGPNAATTRAEQIRSLFPRGLSLADGLVTVSVEVTPEISPSLVDDGWYVLPISISYYSYIRS